MKRLPVLAAVLISGALAGCGSMSSQPTSPVSQTSSGAQTASTSYGVVDSIQMVNTSAGGSGIAGSVVGGVVGGLLGHQIGGGRGQTAATVAGAVGGAVAGNEIDKRRQQNTTAAYQVGVRLDNGSYQTVVQDNVANLNVGDRVRVEDGRVYRY